MISKTIQKEKERQEKYIKAKKHKPKYSTYYIRNNARINTHKQSLINFKEYLESQAKDIRDTCKIVEGNAFFVEMIKPFYARFLEEIQELNKMIEAYA